MDNAFNISYALSKQLGSAYAISTNYGEIQLDDELRIALDAALRPLLKQRLNRLIDMVPQMPPTSDGIVEV